MARRKKRRKARKSTKRRRHTSRRRTRTTRRKSRRSGRAKKGWSAKKLSRYKREKRALINKYNRSGE